MHGITIQSTTREAKRLSALVSPTRSFTPTGKRGVFFMEAEDDAQSLQDAVFLWRQGVTVIDFT